MQNLSYVMLDNMDGHKLRQKIDNLILVQNQIGFDTIIIPFQHMKNLEGKLAVHLSCPISVCFWLLLTASN